MATNYDILFLRHVVSRGLAPRPDALRCLEAIESEAQRGRALNAAQAVLELGLVDRPQAEQVHHAVSRELQAQGELLVPVDHQTAYRDVSSEGEPVPGAPPPAPPPPPRPEGAPPPAADYYDLAREGEGLEDFELGPLIAHGAAGSSYAGRRKSDGAPVVIKTLSRRFAEHPALLEQVLAELRGWVGFTHPRVAATLAVGRSHGHAVVVFERASGRTLEEHLDAHGPLPADEATELMAGLLEAVAAAHARGLHVGDLRARKVYYDGERLALTDLGLARASCLAQGFGQYGLPFGHPSYLAPEVLQEDIRAPTAGADLYACGILFYELLCGHVPFEGDVPEVLEQHLDAPLPRPPEGITFSTAAAGLILRMTAKTDDVRVTDAVAMLRALRRLRAGKPFRLLSLASGQGPVEAVTKDDWEGASAQAGEVPQWTETRIQKAPLVGPSDLQASAIGAPTGPVSARIPRELIAQLEAEAEADDAEAVGRARGPAEARVEVGRKLGRGPVGTAYEGTVAGREGPLAIKVLSRKFAKHPELMERLLGQLRTARGFTHPNVVATLEVLSASGRDVVISELVAGRTLRAVLDAEGPRPLRQAVALVADVAAALEAAHARGLFHGDVRPEKVFLEDEASIARLADFGHAEAACLGAGLGKDGLYFGHPAYLAPEVVQERRREPDARADIYALGITFYELLCGRQPFSGADTKALLLAHLKQRLPPPPDGVAIPPTLADVLLCMTAKDPAKRYASIAELRAALRAGLEVSTSGEHDAAGSALAVEEFDPLASAEDVSPEMWGMHSQVAAKPAANWDKDRIKQARKEGPTSWVPGAKATQDEVGALYHDIRAASGEHQAPRLERRAAKPKAAAGASGFKPTPVQLAAIGGGVVGLLVVVLALLIGGSSGDDEPPAQPERPVATNDVPQPVGPTPEELAAARERRAQELAQAAERYRLEVRDLLRVERYADALARDDALAPELATTPELQEAVRRAESEVLLAAGDRLRRESEELEQLLTQKEFDLAARRLERIAAWAIDRGAVDQLRGRIEQQREADAREVKALASDTPVDLARARAELSARLRGWSSGGQLFPGGGLILRYRRGDPTLAADLRALSGALGELAPTPVSGVRGVHVVADARPVIAALDLPLLQVLELRAEIVVAAPPGDEASVVLLAGLDERRPEGYGVSWGVIPVKRGPSGLQPLLTVPFPDVQPRRVLELQFRVAPGRQGRGNLLGTLADRAGATIHTPKPAPVPLRDLDGRVGLLVTGAEVWIAALEVRGLLDVKALEGK